MNVNALLVDTLDSLLPTADGVYKGAATEYIVFNYTELPADFADDDAEHYRYLDNALAVGYGLETNSLWTATFTLPADDQKNAYCAPLNYVEIFDGDERIDLFRIIGEDLERSNGATRYYNCEHVLATLLSDVLFQYHQCGGSGVKTADVLNYILARQTRQNWKLGDCDFKRYFEYNWENSTLLAALFAVPECFDGEYLWSWDTTVYPWTLSLTVPTETLKSEIRYAKNMTSIKKTTDATSIANRVYALGYGEGVNQLTISAISIFINAKRRRQNGRGKKKD